MPRPATAHSGSASQEIPHDGVTSSSPPVPNVTPQNPTRSRTVRERSGCRPCHADAADQPSDPTTSGVPAAASDQRWVEVSISGR